MFHFIKVMWIIFVCFFDSEEHMELYLTFSQHENIKFTYKKKQQTSIFGHFDKHC